jgi:DNA polymerase bacteriophage-type
MRYVVLDFETASRCDLLKCGAWVYAQDFSTWVLLCAFKVVTNDRPAPTRVLDEGELKKLDSELVELCNDPEVIFLAHNAGFEQAIWKYHMEPMGYPPLPIERWHDTMAACAMRALPLGLDAATTALELQVRKDMDGHRLMLRMCKTESERRVGAFAREHGAAEGIQRCRR